eukprot:5642689-Pleurochrysis_carterae.AAC.7
MAPGDRNGDMKVPEACSARLGQEKESDSQGGAQPSHGEAPLPREHNDVAYMTHGPTKVNNGDARGTESEASYGEVGDDEGEEEEEMEKCGEEQGEREPEEGVVDEREE